jgi:hypothetical protein
MPRARRREAEHALCERSRREPVRDLVAQNAAPARRVGPFAVNHEHHPPREPAGALAKGEQRLTSLLGIEAMKIDGCVDRKAPTPEISEDVLEAAPDAFDILPVIRRRRRVWRASGKRPWFPGTRPAGRDPGET